MSIRKFETGATRNSDAGKYDYEGFIAPQVLEFYAAYMHVNRKLLDGSYRDSDNWQKGIPTTAYVKSLWRHFLDIWKVNRGLSIEEGELAAGAGVMFNAMGWMLERSKADPEWFKRELAKYEDYRKKELEARGTPNS